MIVTHGRAVIALRRRPKEAPTEGIDIAKLARLTAAGGNIRNIALNAAFLAAEGGGDQPTVRMSHLQQAAQSEYAKLERRLTPTEAEAWPAAKEDASPPVGADA